MEENDPFFAFFMPFSHFSMHIEKSVDITMSMRFGLNHDLAINIGESKVGVAVRNGRNFFLFDDY